MWWSEGSEANTVSNSLKHFHYTWAYFIENSLKTANSFGTHVFFLGEHESPCCWPCGDKEPQQFVWVTDKQSHQSEY